VSADRRASPNLKITALGDGSVNIRFDGIPDATYQIEYSDSPGSSNWQTLGSRTADETGVFEMIDRPQGGSGLRVYRSVYQ